MTRNRRGVTVIELLVIVGILGVLLALLLPALIAAREAARRRQCLANLHQIGVALYKYNSTWQMFPPLCTIPAAGTSGSYSVHAQILPYLEAGGLYNALNVQIDAALQATVTSARVSSYLCPSGPNVQSDGKYAPTSYGANAGMWLVWPPAGQYPNEGSFGINRGAQIKDFQDGTANTLGMAEVKAFGAVIHSGGKPDIVNPWPPGVGTSRYPSTPAEVVALGGTITPLYGHSQWASGSILQSGMTTMFPPNAPVLAHLESGEVDVDFISSRLDGPAPQPTYAAITSRSHHLGGANVLLMDGSARFEKDTVIKEIWRVMGTRAGGEVVNVCPY